MKIFLNIYALIFVTKIPQGVVGTKQAFFHKTEQKVLANYVIETKQADSELECGLHCVGDGSCASVNYRTSGDGKGRCELNDKTLQEIPDEGTRDPDFTHLAIVNEVSKII